MINSYTIEKTQNGFAPLGTLGEFDNGGAGSGNWGHAGRPGEVGGSASTSASTRAAGKVFKGITDRVRESGGFTVGADGEFYDLGKTKGYAVGGFGTEGQISVDDWQDGKKRRKFLRKYITKNAHKLRDYDENLLGGWVDDGKVYLDVSRIFKSEKKAAIAAAQTEQDSITDFSQTDLSKAWPTTKDLVKKYGLQDIAKQAKGKRAKERAAEAKKTEELLK